MIEHLLIFRDNGLLLLKKRLVDTEEKETDDLVSGFFSVLFQFFTKHFGDIQSIKTSKNLILISKVHDVYVALISAWITDESQLKINNNTWFLNKRLEEIAINAMNYIKHKLNPFLKNLDLNDGKIYPNTKTLNDLQLVIDETLEKEIQKMNIIRSITG
ncbi:MAG: hypothetical protein GF364_00370, partial [Candidatus Lokiarchaeota archaeon]|nr:hypothetical protein [Candidatus Lokiarchaeota archaeon]